MNSLEDFVRESNRIEGIHRNPYQHEIEEHEELIKCDVVTVGRLKQFVEVVANARLRDKIGMNVRVGNHFPPLGGENIRTELNVILMNPNPYTQHHDYETLHPFTDGNGRSGRALWLWAMKGNAPLGFLHHFYYQSLSNGR